MFAEVCEGLFYLASIVGLIILLRNLCLDNKHCQLWRDNDTMNHSVISKELQNIRQLLERRDDK